MQRYIDLYGDSRLSELSRRLHTPICSEYVQFVFNAPIHHFSAALELLHDPTRFTQFRLSFASLTPSMAVWYSRQWKRQAYTVRLSQPSHQFER